MELRHATDPAWVTVVLQQMDKFIIQHAHAKKQSSNIALSMIHFYPDKSDLVRGMLNLSAEDLMAFQNIMALMEQRNLILMSQKETGYVRQLCRTLRVAPDAYFLDKLLINSIIETRQQERLSLIADAVTEPHLQEFYQNAAQTNHGALYKSLALHYFSHESVTLRLAQLLTIEDDIIKSIPLLPTLQ